MPKKRIVIPSSIAAQVQFEADRTCCVCRKKGKRYQIHHIDEDPTNNDLQNLVVLCLDCHTETHIYGGFSRKLDEQQIRLYRDNWLAYVARKRAKSSSQTSLCLA